MSNKKINPLQSSLSDEEMEELGNFLLSDATSIETMMPDRLDGFLTALVVAPVMPVSSVHYQLKIIELVIIWMLVQI